MNEYEMKQEARRERILARADRLRTEASRRIYEATREGAMPPMGEPIKIGHHSEKRHRAAIARSDMNMRKGVEALDAAKEAVRRAAAVGAGGISSDDPDAIQKLQAELAEAQTMQDAMKARNAAWRKAGNKAGRQPNGEWIEPPCAPYQLTNNSANIRRIEQRIKVLKANASRETREEDYQGVCKLVENAEANRVQIIFPGKPSAEIRTKLKKAGFRWAPSEGAWQRQLNNSAVYWARELVKEIAGA